MTPTKAIVVWEDIFVLDSDTWVEHSKQDSFTWKPYTVETVGFVLYDGPEGIVMTDSIAADHIGPRTQIPRGCIRRFTVESPKADSKRKRVR